MLEAQAKDGYGPVGSCGQAMGMGNPSDLALDMSRSGLTVSGRQVTAIGERVQSVPLIKSMDINETEGMQWLESNHPFSYIRNASLFLCRHARASSYILKHKQN